MTKLDEILENYPDEEFLKADGFDLAIIGVEANSLRLVYSVEKCIELLMEDDGMSYEDGIEHLYFNVIGAYVGENTPIWVNTL